MKLNRSAVIGICADAWGITPKEFRERMRRKEISVGDVTVRIRLEIYRNPMAAQAFLDWLLPGVKTKQRRNRYQNDMIESFKRAAAARKRGKT